MKNILKKLKDEIINNKKYSFIAIVISGLTLLPHIVLSSSIMYSTIVLSIVLMVVLISSFSKILFSLFIIYFNAVTVFLFNIKIHWGGSSDGLIQRIDVAAISPRYETVEYLNTYIDYRDYFVVLCVLLITIFLFKFIKSYMNSYKIVKKIAFFLSIILFFLLKNYGPLGLIKEYIIMSKMSPMIVARAEYLSSEKNKKACKFSEFIYDKIVIIQGEAANKHHMDIYDYKFETTPFMSNLLKKHKVYKFNVIAPANQTRYSIPMFYTKADVHNWKKKYIYSRSILSDFKDCHYETYWISNQGKIGEHDSFVASIAKEADHQLFFNQADSSITAKMDDVIINNYLKNKKLNDNKELYVFHLQGSHFAYNKRYSNKHCIHLNPKDIVEEYDNTIFFTDYLIKKIIQYFSENNQKLLVIYESDHGEVVNTDKHGHGFFPSFKDEYEIPLVIFSNIKNDRLDMLSNKNRKKLFNLENLNYLIKYVAGILDSPHLSYSSDILCTDYKIIKNYKKLHFYN